MKEITSINNETIKQTVKLHQKKYRNGSHLFIIEGIKGLEEAIKSNVEVKDIFTSNQKFLKNNILPQNKMYIVTEQIMKKLSTTESPPEIIAVAKQKEHSIKDILKNQIPLILVFENIKDAGNLGTIVRSAAAFDCSGIILLGDTVDIYNPKTVRASAGNLWKIPVIIYKNEISSLKEEINSIKKCNFIATNVEKQNKTKYIQDYNFKNPAVIIFGSEAEGISKESLHICNASITIPMKDNVESLNLSISAGLVLYESFRQRLHV